MISQYFEIMPYRLNKATGLIDYTEMEHIAELIRPKIIVAGACSYSRLIDYERIRNIADKVGAYVVVDISYISGLMAAKVIPSCFPWTDVVITTTSSLLGPRGAMIFYRKGWRADATEGELMVYDFEEKINAVIFSGMQDGPYNHTLGAISVALKQALTPEFVDYQVQVFRNSARLAADLQQMGYELISGGTDNHLVTVNVHATHALDGARVHRILKLAGIACNTAIVPQDTSNSIPGGICLGTLALTSRGFNEDDIAKVAEYFDRAVCVAIKLKDVENFMEKCSAGPGFDPDVLQLHKEVRRFAASFAANGCDERIRVQENGDS